MSMARITRWSLAPLVVVLISTALTPGSQGGSITFTGDVKFLNPFKNQATYPSTNGAGGLQIFGIKPGGDRLNNTDTGFVYTNADIQYTAAAADIGQTISVFWTVSRPFTNTAGNFTTSSSLSGTVTVPAGGLIESIGANTFWRNFPQGNTSSVVDVGPFDNTKGAADKTFNMVRGGNTVTVTSAPFAEPANDKGTYLMEQVAILFEPSKAGQLFKFDFPDSVVGSTNAVPEPSSLILIAIAGSAVAAMSWRARWRNSTRVIPVINPPRLPERGIISVGSSFSLNVPENDELTPIASDHKPIAIKIKHLDAISAAVDEEEEMAGQEVLAEAFLDQPRETVEALAHVCGSSTEEDADGRGEHDHGVASRPGRPASAATTRPSHSGSGGESKRSRTW